MDLPGLTLIVGGARSGKSSHAIALATAYASERRAFIATAEARDEEMRARIEQHRVSRGLGFDTLEEPVELCAALESLQNRAAVAVLDCLTLWISNLLERGLNDERISSEADRLIVALRGVSFPTIVVSDEVGSGIVPVNPLARRFRDLLGWTNQKVARSSEQVILMAAGCPLRFK